MKVDVARGCLPGQFAGGVLGSRLEYRSGEQANGTGAEGAVGTRYRGTVGRPWGPESGNSGTDGAGSGTGCSWPDAMLFHIPRRGGVWGTLISERVAVH